MPEEAPANETTEAPSLQVGPLTFEALKKNLTAVKAVILGLSLELVGDALTRTYRSDLPMMEIVGIVIGGLIFLTGISLLLRYERAASFFVRAGQPEALPFAQVVRTMNWALIVVVGGTTLGITLIVCVLISTYTLWGR